MVGQTTNETIGGQEFAVRCMDRSDFDNLIGRLERHEQLREEDIAALIDIIHFGRHLVTECRWTDEEVKRLRAVILDRGAGKVPEVGRPEPENQPKPTADDSAKKPDSKESKEQSRPGRRRARDRRCGTVHHHALQGIAAEGRCPFCGAPSRDHKTATILRVTGRSPFEVHRHEQEGRRCKTCQAVIRAELPASVHAEAIGNLDFTAVAALMVWRYEFGQPFYRMECFTGLLGDRISDTTMWDAVAEAAAWLLPLYRYYLRLAANAGLLGFDDVSARVIQLKREIEAEIEAAKILGQDPRDVRTGIHTSCFVARTGDGHSFVLYFTGRHHCGEKLDDLLAAREVEYPLKTVSDMASTNRDPNTSRVVVIQGGCWQHVRAYFIEIESSFPEQCGVVIEMIKTIFVNEAKAKASGLSAEDRLAYHQAESQPIVDSLYAWCQDQKINRLYEPNSPLGKAMAYLTNHKTMLTEFLRTPGIPIDNNDTEYAGKRPKRHQHNSLSYLTTTGSTVGDIVMTLVSAVKRVDDNAFEYLTFLMRHRSMVRAHPEKFVAWRWRETEAEMMSRVNPEAPPDWRSLVAVHQHQGQAVEVSRDASL